MNTQIEEFLKTVPHVKLPDEQSQEQFKKAYEFAERTHQLEGLLEPFRSINRWGEGNHPATVWMFPDFAPHSFYFQIFPAEYKSIPANWQQVRIMNGGIIYHGKLEDGQSPETFSVNLTPSTSWNIHT